MSVTPDLIIMYYVLDLRKLSALKCSHVVKVPTLPCEAEVILCDDDFLLNKIYLLFQGFLRAFQSKSIAGPGAWRQENPRLSHCSNWGAAAPQPW